jgi:hypothetical protein
MGADGAEPPPPHHHHHHPSLSTTHTLQLSEHVPHRGPVRVLARVGCHRGLDPGPLARNEVRDGLGKRDGATRVDEGLHGNAQHRPDVQHKIIIKTANREWVGEDKPAGGEGGVELERLL